MKKSRISRCHSIVKYQTTYSWSAQYYMGSLKKKNLRISALEKMPEVKP